jgi:lipopolysaccharide/colanic/teichoic acid biosynthesis glycosyltransferase
VATYTTEADQITTESERDRIHDDLQIVDLQIIEQPVSVQLERQPGPYERYAKRPLDLAGSMGLLIVLAPVIAAVGAAVRSVLGRPVLFRQVRIARGGSSFVMLKFRSMHAADPTLSTSDEPHTAEDSPRVGPLGHFIRHTSLDELPQLVNVLRGEMSLVGPRPEIRSVAETHELVDHPRHLVRPGITGPWQVSDHRPGFVHDHVSMDVEYVENITFRRDMNIVARTVAQLCRSMFDFVFKSSRTPPNGRRTADGESTPVAA